MTQEQILRITYSQDLHQLAEAWIEECFCPSSSPFERRIVVVPNLAMKEFLLQAMMSHPRLQIAAGCTILPLHSAILEMVEGEKKVPSPAELGLWIEEILLQEGGVFGKSSVNEYVQKLLSSPSKLSLFCSEVARVFLDYGVYGKEWLEAWLQEEGWQQWLWKKVHAVFSYPALFLQQRNIFDGRVYVFGFSTLPMPYLQFFSKTLSICYFFSPCAQFWVDSLSRFEKKGLQSLAKRLGASLQTQSGLQEYLQEDHPLLANFGKLGRDFIKEIDKIPFIDEERYEIPSSASFLHKIQHSLLSNTVGKFPYDDSIQIHSAPTKLQEVEVLQKRVGALLQKDPEMLPQDILVIVSDLAAYTPFIDAVFSHTETPYKIETKVLLSEEERSFLHLLEWPSRNFAIEDVKKIFSSPLLQKKCKLSFQEIEKLTDFFALVGIRSKLDSDAHSWQSGLDRLLYGLVLEEGTGIDPSPVCCVNHAEIELLQKFSDWFSSFQKESSSFQEKRGMGEWLSLLTALFEKYFPQDEESRSLREMKKMARSVPFSSNPLFSFERALLLVKQLSGKGETSSQIDKILFLSAESLHIPPAKTIWYLGADEELLPRMTVKMNLSEMPSLPSPVDRQRYLFIEALMKAKERLIVSYERVSSEDGKEKRVSPFIEEISSLVEGGEIPVISHQLAAIQPIKKVCFFDEVSREKKTAITVKELTSFAKNPLRSYLRETLGIVPPFSEDEQSRAFLLPSWERRRFLSKSCSVSELQASGKLPQGRFSLVAQRELQEEFVENQDCLRHFGLQERDVRSLTLIKDLRVSREEGKIPALSLPPFTVEGELGGITDQGFLVKGEVLSVWPLYLLYACLFPQASYLLLLEDKKQIEIKLPNPQEALLSYLEFYTEALSSCCPLVEGTLSYFEKGDVEGFLSFCRKSEDSSLQYLARKKEEEWLKEQFILWQPRVMQIYAPLREVSQ